MSKPSVLYATTNPGKIFEISKYLGQFGISVLSPTDLGLSLEVPETGSTLEANATAKVKAYLATGVNHLIVSDDTGIAIDALNGEPGVHVRSWNGGTTRMTDREVIDYCLTRLQGVPKEKRTAQFRTVIALGLPATHQVELFDGTLKGTILAQADILRVGGFPFESLFFVPEWNLLLGQVHQLPADQKRHFLSHRERAFAKALPRIHQLLSPSL